jgi:hypothetical protein
MHGAKRSTTKVSLHRTTPMVRVTLCLQLLLLVFIPKQSDAAPYQSSELLGEIDRSEADMANTTELQHHNGEEVRDCCVGGYYI